MTARTRKPVTSEVEDETGAVTAMGTVMRNPDPAEVLPARATVHQALLGVMQAVRAVGKDQQNPQQGFRFRGVDAVLNAVGPAFREHGLMLIPHVRDVTYTTEEIGQQRRPTGFARVVVDYTLVGPDGSSLSGSAPGEGMDYGDKALPKAMSVALRTFLLQVLCLPTEDAHPDPDSEVYDRSPAAPRAPVHPRPPRAPAEDPELVVARQELEAKMTRLSLDPQSVLAAYKVDNGPAADPRTETDVARLRSFTDRLAP